MKLYDKFHKEVLRGKYNLHARAPMIAQSNGGLISYAWAFRNRKHVHRIFGILPATDLRSFPGLEKVVGPKRITPEGLCHPLTLEELKVCLGEFNPIDQLRPPAQAERQDFSSARRSG